MFRNLNQWIRATLILPVVSAFWTTWALAQQSDPTGTATSTTTTSTSEVWYGNWWIWAVLIGVFLIVVIALTSRGRNA